MMTFQKPKIEGSSKPLGQPFQTVKIEHQPMPDPAIELPGSVFADEKQLKPANQESTRTVPEQESFSSKDHRRFY